MAHATWRWATNGENGFSHGPSPRPLRSQGPLHCRHLYTHTPCNTHTCSTASQGWESLAGSSMPPPAHPPTHRGAARFTPALPEAECAHAHPEKPEPTHEGMHTEHPQVCTWRHTGAQAADWLGGTCSKDTPCGRAQASPSSQTALSAGKGAARQPLPGGHMLLENG